MNNYPITLHHLYTSKQHSYFGSPNQTPQNYPLINHHNIELITDKGIVGDRFFDRKLGLDSQVSFINYETIRLLGHAPVLFRRNIVMSGVNVQELIGKKFQIGDVTFEGVKHCAPCKWMDIVMGQGTMKQMRGRGGPRARVLSGAILSKDEQILLCEAHLSLPPSEALKKPKLPF
jgi:MOSC domain-containing protein YiiM